VHRIVFDIYMHNVLDRYEVTVFDLIEHFLPIFNVRSSRQPPVGPLLPAEIQTSLSSSVPRDLALASVSRPRGHRATSRSTYRPKAGARPALRGRKSGHRSKRRRSAVIAVASFLHVAAIGGCPATYGCFTHGESFLCAVAEALALADGATSDYSAPF
jgi:hypothetical protein